MTAALVWRHVDCSALKKRRKRDKGQPFRDCLYVGVAKIRAARREEDLLARLTAEWLQLHKRVRVERILKDEL